MLSSKPVQKALCGVLLSVLCHSGWAQQAESEQAVQAPPTGEVLRLEATIRADKEQPRVLSIVPWQLPEHRSLQATQPWLHSDDLLKPLERQSFLRALDSYQALYASQTQQADEQ